MKKQTTFILLLLMISSCLVYSQGSIATYSVTFESNWSQTTHPHTSGNLPANAHWSKLVGATHNDQITFLEMGQTATSGIENVAELGSNTVFFSEINDAITAGFANELIDGGSLGTPGGQIVINNVVTTEDFPLLTLVSMIAPSPDWMIAINSISLLDSSDNWEDEIILDLFPYDAGTDSGVDYTSANSDTNPKEPITSAQGITPFSSEKIGTLTITLEEVVLGFQNFEAANTISVFPNPTYGNITIFNASSDIKSIEIYNMIGIKVFSLNNIDTSRIEVDFKELPTGTYLLSTTDITNKKTVKRLIKF